MRLAIRDEQAFQEGEGMSEDSGIEYTEEIRQGMTPDGSEVVEDIVTAVDTETGDALVDDLIVSVAPDGSATVEETVAAVDDSGAGEIIVDVVEEIDPA